MKNRIKKTAAKVPTPRTKADMENLIDQIATLKRAEAALKTEMDSRIAAIKGEFERSLSDIETEVKGLCDAAETWATSNPEEFGKKKSIEFLHGIVGFRTSTPKLEPISKKWNWKTITTAVEQLLPAFIRNKPEVDKEAILAQRDELSEFLPNVGLKVSQEESFFVDVTGTKTETRETTTVTE